MRIRARIFDCGVPAILRRMPAHGALRAHRREAASTPQVYATGSHVADWFGTIAGPQRHGMCRLAQSRRIASIAARQLRGIVPA